MKFFDVRQSGDYATGAPWPVEPPALRRLDTPTRVQVPLGAYLSSASARQAAPGSTVSKGQRLGDAASVGAPVPLAPTSGRVVGTSTVTVLNGRTVRAVDIEPDFEDRPPPGESHDAYHAQEQHEAIEQLDEVGPAELAAWVDRLSDYGVWADRAGSPNLAEQLLRAMRQPVDVVICNVLDDEPTLRLNAILAARFATMVMAGVTLMARLTQARQAVFAVEAGAPAKWWAPLRRLARKQPSVHFAPLLNDYPQGNPTLLLYRLTNRRLRPGQSPVEQRAVVLDAAAAIAVGRAAARHQSMLQVPFAVRDHVAQETHHLVVPVGTSLRDVLHGCGIGRLDHVTLRRGTVLQEQDVAADAVVAGGDLTLHVMPRQVPPIPDPCIRCAWCAESCPTRVQPAGLLEAAQAGDVELGRHYGLDACIECGVCTYVCPSRLPLLRGIRKLKAVAIDEVGGGTGRTAS